jgi:hypothetical protein
MSFGKISEAACQHLVDVATGSAAAGEKEREAKRDAALAPYRKVLNGEKLAFVEDNFLVALYGKGGQQLTSAAAVKNAPAIFTWGRRSVNGREVHTIRRHAFKGMKAKGTVERQYLDAVPASAWR